MLEIDETTLQAINAAIDKFLSLAEAKKDIRLMSGTLSSVGNKIRAMAELKETPDNRFVAFLTQFLISDIFKRLEGQDEEWFELNKELLDQCLQHTKNFMTGLKSSINSKSFDKVIDTIKMFFFAYWHTVLALTG